MGKIYQYFTKEHMLRTKKQIKKIFNISRLQKLQTKTHYTHSLEWLKLNKLTIPNVGRHVEELEFLYIANVNVKLYNHFGK